MSPNQIKIKELDGLPAGEIHLAIANSEIKIVSIMEQKLDTHRELIEERLDSQDAKLNNMQENLTALVGTPQVPGLVNRNTELLEGLVEKHETWHEQDQEFRALITHQVEQLSEQHNIIAKDVKTVTWFIRTCSAFGKVGKSTMFLVTEGKDVYKALGVSGIVWLSVVQFKHYAWPVILAWLHHGLR